MFTIGPPIIAPWTDRLHHELEHWRGTRYAEGSGCRGRASDCVGFVAAVMDRLHGVTAPLIRPVAQDTAMHSRELARAAALTLASRYPHVRIESGEIEPGDVLVLTNGLGPGHVMIADFDPVIAWHCTRGAGVVTGSVAGHLDRIDHVLRSTEKPRWSSSPSRR